MKRNGALVVVGLFIALCGSACSSFFFGGIPSGVGPVPIPATTISTTATLTAVPGHVLASSSGTGGAALGSFSVHGQLSLEGVCTGRGALEVEVMTSSANGGTGTMCPDRNLDFSLGAHNGRARIRVYAPASVSWSLDLVELS